MISAKGIVTRMGQDLQGLGGEAIEPGSCAAGIRPCIQGQSAIAWINESTGRNRAAWLSISDFLARENLREVLQARAAEARAHAGVSACAGASAAALQSLPDGNHGENLSTGRSA
ncbi:MAG: hypothetical protein J0H59_01655 [Comamonadaceae bacterium]|jgi:hypothetical protein|nr:hypothetical protein [Comamonadaceae bacterium]